MNPKFKLGAYAVLLILVAWLGRGFYSNYNAIAHGFSETATNEPPAAVTNAPSTNTPASSTNELSTNAVAPAPTNTVPAVASAAPARQGFSGRTMRYLAAFVGAIIGLGLLIAYDITQYMGNVAVDVLFDDRGAGERDPEYEKAEQVWANGKPLEAIQMMRDFLKAHPREQYAAFRIAEIYEKDLQNYLAASMEYEDLLKQKLPPERWGWAAIHLCNLYSKLNQQDKGMALLQRVVDDYPKTAAAKKARDRLGLPEPEVVETKRTGPAGEPDETATEAIEDYPPPPSVPAEPEPPKSSLPPGFRPKK